MFSSAQGYVASQLARSSLVDALIPDLVLHGAAVISFGDWLWSMGVTGSETAREPSRRRQLLWAIASVSTWLRALRATYFLLYGVITHLYELWKYAAARYRLKVFPAVFYAEGTALHLQRRAAEQIDTYEGLKCAKSECSDQPGTRKSRVFFRMATSRKLRRLWLKIIDDPDDEFVYRCGRHLHAYTYNQPMARHLPGSAFLSVDTDMVSLAALLPL
ncbi:hypothetical protein JCM11641_006128 [Rhodosporidiobolus odoratus]